jgi:hypothetical protein
MTIKVKTKLIRTDSSVNWHSFRHTGWYVRDAAFAKISKGSGLHQSQDGPRTFVSAERPDGPVEEYDLTIIITHTWPDLDTYNATVGDWDASNNSAWKTYATARGAYNELNNITRIRYIYDEDNNLTTTQKQVNKVYWEDYSE